MRHGIFDEYAWFEWAETLPADQPPSIARGVHIFS